MDPLCGADEPVVGLEARYLASVESYGSREAALASLLNYVLPPTYIEENDLGFVFRYLMWPMADETPTLIWPETKLRGLPRGGCLLHHNPYDIVQACLMRGWVKRGLLTNYRHYMRNKMRQEIMVNTGLSPEGNDTLYRFLPISKAWTGLGERPGPDAKRQGYGYPGILLRNTTVWDILWAILGSDAERMEFEGFIFLHVDDYLERHPFIQWKRPSGVRGGKIFDGTLKKDGKVFLVVSKEKLLAEIEGGN